MQTNNVIIKWINEYETRLIMPAVAHNKMWKQLVRGRGVPNGILIAILHPKKCAHRSHLIMLYDLQPIGLTHTIQGSSLCLGNSSSVQGASETT